MYQKFNEMRRDLIGCGCIPVNCNDVPLFVAYCAGSGLIVFGGAFSEDGKSQYLYI